METELSFGQTTFLLWVPPFLSYELWKLRIELLEHLIQTGSSYFWLPYRDSFRSKLKLFYFILVIEWLTANL